MDLPLPTKVLTHDNMADYWPEILEALSLVIHASNFEIMDSFGIIESVQNNKYILHAMKDNVAPTGVLICIQWYGRSVILWVGHSRCD